VIAVLGSRLDKAACALVDAWSSADAVLVSAEDVCSPGWSWRLAGPARGRFVAAGVVREVADLRGVLVRRPAIAPEELGWVHKRDRVYVAAEVNAFLVAWLASLPCRVLNRPSATSLSGPAWSPLHWQLAAARSGVAWAITGGGGLTCDVVVCSPAVHGAKTHSHEDAARRLAEISGADLLGIRFAGDAAVAVTRQPSLALPEVREMIRAELDGAEAGRAELDGAQLGRAELDGAELDEAELDRGEVLAS
jgi:hypothetical protein